MRKRKLKKLLAEQTALAKQFCAERNEYCAGYEQQRKRVAELEARLGAATATPVGVQAKVRVIWANPAGGICPFTVLSVESVHGETCIRVKEPPDYRQGLRASDVHR